LSFRVYVKEENRKLPISIGKLEAISRYTFSVTGKEEGEISLVVCDDPFMTDLNERYTQNDGPTDVLAFPMREGERLPQQGSEAGDIVISIDTAERQSKELGTDLKQEITVLFVHGLLHLLGYDHQTKDEKMEMDETTNKIVTGV